MAANDVDGGAAFERAPRAAPAAAARECPPEALQLLHAPGYQGFAAALPGAFFQPPLPSHRLPPPPHAAPAQQHQQLEHQHQQLEHQHQHQQLEHQHQHQQREQLQQQQMPQQHHLQHHQHQLHQEQQPHQHQQPQQQQQQQHHHNHHQLQQLHHAQPQSQSQPHQLQPPRAAVPPYPLHFDRSNQPPPARAPHPDSVPSARNALARSSSRPRASERVGAPSNTRWRPSPQERDMLLHELARNPYPDVDTKTRLAANMGVKRPQISKWFQHRRETMSKSGEFRGVSQRVRRTEKELAVLNASFEADPYPRLDTMVEIASDLSLTYKQVKLWFKHRRHSESRRQTKDFQNSSSALPRDDARNGERKDSEGQGSTDPARRYPDSLGGGKSPSEHSGLDEPDRGQPSSFFPSLPPQGGRMNVRSGGGSVALSSSYSSDPSDARGPNALHQAPEPASGTPRRSVSELTPTQHVALCSVVLCTQSLTSQTMNNLATFLELPLPLVVSSLSELAQQMGFDQSSMQGTADAADAIVASDEALLRETQLSDAAAGPSSIIDTQMAAAPQRLNMGDGSVLPTATRGIREQAMPANPLFGPITAGDDPVRGVTRHAAPLDSGSDRELFGIDSAASAPVVSHRVMVNENGVRIVGGGASQYNPGSLGMQASSGSRKDERLRPWS